MAEAARLINMLRASAANKNCGRQHLSPICEHSGHQPASCEEHSPDTSSVPTSFVSALELLADKAPLPPKPSEGLGNSFNFDLKNTISILNLIFPPGATYPAPPQQVKDTTSDIANDLAVATCKRIFAAALNQRELTEIARGLHIPTATMTNRFPSLKMTTADLPQQSASESLSTASPARGSAMLNSIFKSVRVPEFRFKWQFWAEKGQSTTASASEEYASRPKPLGDQIISIKEFYQHFNNIPTDSLKLRDSIHLFHLGVKPLWEDPRNSRGGAWYFRVNKDVAGQVWHEIALLAVGDVLQAAVETKRDCKPQLYIPTKS